MDSLHTAEAVTRHLRSKKISVEDAESTAHMLWQGQLPVYLPNTPQFLFELLCDRMGDLGSGSFGRWKKSPALWRLWRSIYKKLSDSDVEARNAIFSRVKLLSIMCAVLDDHVAEKANIGESEKCTRPNGKRQRICADTGDKTSDQNGKKMDHNNKKMDHNNKKMDQNDKKLDQNGKTIVQTNKSMAQSPSEIVPEIVPEMFACVQDILTYGYIDVDEYSAVGLLSSYCRYIKCFGVADFRWTETVKTLYELPHQYILYKPGKKTWSRYFSQVVPVQLSLFVDSESSPNCQWNDSIQVMHVMFCTFLFKYTSSAGLVQPVTQLVEDQKSAPNRMSDSCILRLFHEIIVNLAVSEIHTCEAVYKALVQEPYAHLAEELVSVLAKVNRTLSPDFYSSIYADALACVPVNWTLVSHIMKLHPALYTGWKSVVDGCQHYRGKPLEIIAQNLVSCFDAARELLLFMSEVYPYAAQYAGWTQDTLMDDMATQLTNLSVKHLLSLAQQYLQNDAVKPMSLLVRVLARSPAHKHKSCQGFFSNVSKFHKKGWAEVLYQVICLYPNTEGVGEMAVGSQTPSNYDVYLVFRLGELQKLGMGVSLGALFQKHLQQLDQDSLTFFLERWLVLLDQKCPEVYPELFGQMFQKWDKSRILEFLEVQKMQLCEMPNFLTALSSYMQENKMIDCEITSKSSSSPKSSKSPQNIPISHAILQFLPSVVFRKFFSPFLEILIANAMDPQFPREEAFLARSTLNHLLSSPNLSSTIEKDFASLYQYVVSADEEARHVTLETAHNIWAVHLRSIKTRKSAEFVETAMKEMKRIMKEERETKTKKPKEFGESQKSKILKSSYFPSVSILLTHRFLSLKTDKVDLKSLMQKFISLICSSMDSQNFEELFALLDALPGISDFESDISGVLQKFGSFSMSAETKTIMFSLMSKIADESKAIYVLALFLVLRTELPACRASLQKELSLYLRQLSDCGFEKCFSACLEALKTWDEFSPANLDVLAALVPLVRRDSMTHAGLVTAGLSRYVDYCERVDEATALSFLAMLTDLVSGAAWALKPYVVELMMGTAYKTLTAKPPTDSVYMATTKLVLYIVNAQRSKFTGRYHVVTQVISGLMVPLTEKAQQQIQKSNVVACASGLSRLLTMLCEPPVQASSHSDSLTSKAAVYRAALRKHAHVMLVNYINYRLEMKFSPETNDALMPGLFSLIGLFSQTELELVSQCLDSSGRTYFQSLYGLYMDHGKWKE